MLPPGRTRRWPQRPAAARARGRRGRGWTGGARRPAREADGAGQGRGAAALAEPLGQHEGCGEQHRARVGDSLAGERVGGTVCGAEDARRGRGEPSPGDRPAVGEACGDLDRGAGELGRADDDVETLRGEDERADRVLRREPLDLEPVMPVLEARGFVLPALVDADEGDPAAASAGEQEGPFERPPPCVSVPSGARIESSARPSNRTREIEAAEIEIGFERRQHGVALRGDEHGVGPEQRAPRRERKRAAEARQCVGSERNVPLVDVKAVLERDGGERTARLGHHFWPDAVPRQADDGVCARRLMRRSPPRTTRRVTHADRYRQVP